MSEKPSSHLTAVLLALFVTFLWSTSWVLIKIGLQDIPALTFAGLRYSLAFLFLLPFLLRKSEIAEIRGLSSRQWSKLILLGLVFYFVVQGAQFWGLAYLPASSVNLILVLTNVVVAVMGILWLAEKPKLTGWFGIMLTLVGTVIFFYPVYFPPAQAIAVLIVMIGMVANAGSAVLGRQINFHESISPLVVTGVSMGVGGGLLLVTGSVSQGLPELTISNWAIIAWLAIINTAIAFTLWNYTLRTLQAVESSIINSTMLIQIAILAWLFLGEKLSSREIIGLCIAFIGVMLVQIRPSNQSIDTGDQ